MRPPIEGRGEADPADRRSKVPPGARLTRGAVEVEPKLSVSANDPTVDRLRDI